MNLGIGLVLQRLQLILGASNAMLLTGSGPPSSGQGNDGDGYFDTSNVLDLYVKSGGTWTAVNLIPGGADGNMLVALGGRFSRLAKSSSKGTSLGPGPVTGSLGYFMRPDFVPADYGWLAWAFDVGLMGATATALTAGQMSGVKIHVPEACTISNLILSVNIAGATLTANQCFAALYQGTTLLGQTADQSANWQSTGLKSMALSSPAAVAAGDLYLTFWSNGTTQPRFGIAQNGVGSPAVGTTRRFITANSGLTTTAPATMAFNDSSFSFWGALS